MGRKAKNRVLQCYLCRMIIKNKVSNLRRHINLHGPRVDCFKCCECDCTFQNKNNLKVHWRRKHKDCLASNKSVKMVPTSRESSRFRAVQPIKKCAAPKIPFIGSLAAKTEPAFGKSPVFVSKLLDHRLKTAKSTFGHLAFGSNLPSFKQLYSDSFEIGSKNQHTLTILNGASENLCVKKTMLTTSTDVPDILRAVGLLKLNRYAPKYYKSKSEQFVDVNPSDVTLDNVDFYVNSPCNFGKLCW